MQFRKHHYFGDDLLATPRERDAILQFLDGEEYVYVTPEQLQALGLGEWTFTLSLKRNGQVSIGWHGEHGHPDRPDMSWSCQSIIDVAMPDPELDDDDDDELSVDDAMQNYIDTVRRLGMLG